MTEIIGVNFNGSGKQYYFDPAGLSVEAGASVIVETARGLEFASCVTGNTMVEDNAIVQPLRSVVRIATPEDVQTAEQNRERETRAARICEERIAAHGLDMKLVDVKYSFEGNKVTFFFTSDDRVDFRALVKDLASALHARIELRQIGVRDEARMIGGLGVCGNPLCCTMFLNEFQPVSIKMAKTQNLSLNPTKISGTCGRLMCCLKYEQEAYEDAAKRMPKNESFVETPDGAGTVCQVNLLQETAKVRLDSAPETPKCYQNCEMRIIRNGKGKRPEDYVEPPLEELAKLRKEPERSILADYPGFGEEPDYDYPEEAGFSEHAEEWAAPAEETPEEPHRSRRHRRGGKGHHASASPEKSAQGKQEKHTQGAAEKQGKPASGKQGKGSQEKQGKSPSEKQASPEAKAAQSQGEKKSGKSGSRHRYYHQKKSGGSGSPHPRQSQP